MLVLILGLLVFIGTHSVRIFADDWRSRQIARLGDERWKMLHSLGAAAGLALIVWGFGLARSEPQVLWQPPTALRHLAALLTLPAFILLTLPYLPGSRIKAAVGHPMALGVAFWSLAHLLCAGKAHDVLLFGAFLVWSLASFTAARRRDRLAGTSYPRSHWGRDAGAVALGVLSWAAFAFYLHGWLIGVRPFG